jgi:hypothetical protein
MNVIPFARRDLLSLWRSRAGPLLVVVFAFAAVAVVAARISGTPLSNVYGLGLFVGQFVFPAVGLLFGVSAVVSHRELGSLRLLFTLPGRRRNVILGTFLSRAGCLVGGLTCLGVVMSGVAVVFGAPPVRPLVLSGVTAALTIAWLSYGTLVSTVVATQRRAFVVAVVSYAAGVVVWNTLFPVSPDVLVLMLGDSVGVGVPHVVERGVLLIAPGNAYLASLQFLGSENYSNLVASFFGQPIPSGLLALGVLGCWTAVPLTVSVWWARRTDVT